MKAITFKAQVITARIKKDGTAQIYIRVTRKGKSSYIATGLIVLASDFNNSMGFCKEKFKDQRKVVECKKINILLNVKIAEHKTNFLDVEDLDNIENLSAKKIVDDIKTKKTKNNLEIIDFLSETEKYYLTLNRIGNAKQYRTAKNSFRKFLEKVYNVSDVSVKKLTNNLIDEYIDFLNIDKKNHNTILKYVITIQAAYNRGIKTKKIDELKENPFKNINLTKNRIAPRHRALSKNQIDSLKQYKPLKDEELAYDIFFFSYYNRGMSWNDMCLLKKHDIINNKITYTRKKTGGNFIQDISVTTLPMVKKYWEMSESNYLFPFILNVNVTEKQLYRRVKYCCERVNIKLTKIGINLGIEDLTTYVARHCFATTLIRAGVHPVLIQNAMGHSDLKITQNYINQFDNEDIIALNDLL